MAISLMALPSAYCTQFESSTRPGSSLEGDVHHRRRDSHTRRRVPRQPFAPWATIAAARLPAITDPASDGVRIGGGPAGRGHRVRALPRAAITPRLRVS